MQHRPWLAVIELMQYGNLKDVLRVSLSLLLCTPSPPQCYLTFAVQACFETGITLAQGEQIHFCRQIAVGLEYIAAAGYVHADTAARNCLLHTNNVVKISDFGNTRAYDVGKKLYTIRASLKLSQKWLAPEVMEFKKLDGMFLLFAFPIYLFIFMTHTTNLT